ncbi:MAG: hypothetical protein ABR600_03015, partial [Actinomycetota bacterium]
FIWRYLKLGLLVLAVFMPLLTVFVRDGRARPSGFGVLVLTGTAMGVDFLLTFVTPALAFSTYKVTEALRIGIGMIRSKWPRSGWYVVAPPLALFGLARGLRSFDFNLLVSITATIVVGLVASAARGATVAFYSRVHDVDDDGAVSFTEQGDPAEGVNHSMSIGR